MVDVITRLDDLERTVQRLVNKLDGVREFDPLGYDQTIGSRLPPEPNLTPGPAPPNQPPPSKTRPRATKKNKHKKKKKKRSKKRSKNKRSKKRSKKKLI